MSTAKKPPPNATSLAAARLALPDAPSQGWVADQVSEILGEEVKQQAISNWEGDKVDLRRVLPKKLAAYAQVLGISKEEFAKIAGYTYKELFQGLEEPPRRGPPVPPVVPFRETQITIPAELLQMVEKYGDDYPVLKTVQMQRMLAAPRNFGGAEVGPQTAEDWFDYWMANKRFLT